ncbi:Vacuolar fusion protein mon1 [Myotisia sp. PD_48]|nr:Vacuolar fusion protein mon1 [Myotisia sp. PD_48]
MDPTVPQSPVPDREPETCSVRIHDFADNSRPEGQMGSEETNMQEQRPPLPPRPRKASEGEPARPLDSSLAPYSASHTLQSRPTTALSFANINTGALDGASRDAYALPTPSGSPGRTIRPKSSSARLGSSKDSDAGDSASIRSFVPESDTPLEAGSIFGDSPGIGDFTENRHLPTSYGLPDALFGMSIGEDSDLVMDFEDEFVSVDELDGRGTEDETRSLEAWRRKKKHFFILSSAGKPIYARHGDDSLISPFIGIIQTIISFYQESGNNLKSFSAGNTKIVVLPQGPLYLVAISSLIESESQLRTQLDALYMQILSTLTLPALDRIFVARPGTDLRRPLQGTESLLSSLSDSFTRGSPSTLLTALESLKLRKAHRQVINNTLLKCKAEPLLYGLIVAGGRLVSVIRPKKHSLHPGDLQLIFNMIFEADGVKTGGGENWIPICLPGFNNTGYLYMYVSFLDIHSSSAGGQLASTETSKDDVVATILISPDKESFFTLQHMRNSLVEQLENNGSLAIIRTALEKGRPVPTDIVPGTVLRHFLYKSKANVQFTMSSYSPDFDSALDRRRLLSAYHALHASVHAKHSQVKVQYSVSTAMNSLAWVTPTFDLYCVASPNSNRNALSQSANKIAMWVQKEEERVFIIGGGVSTPKAIWHLQSLANACNNKQLIHSVDNVPIDGRLVYVKSKIDSTQRITFAQRLQIDIYVSRCSRPDPLE